MNSTLMGAYVYEERVFKSVQWLCVTVAVNEIRKNTKLCTVFRQDPKYILSAITP
jgi:hypothetical protein